MTVPATLASAPNPPSWLVPLEFLPEQGRPEQLILLLHGWSQRPDLFLPLAQALRQQFPQAAILAPQAPDPADPGLESLRGGDTAPVWQWYSISDIAYEDRWRQKVQASVLQMEAWVRHQQQRLGVDPAATALGGFSQGGLLALHTAMTVPGIVGRVLAFGARMIDLPPVVPKQTTFHLFHGANDRIFAVEHIRALFEHIGEQQGDATLDIAHGVGHELHTALVNCLMHQLTHHIPLRTWQAAMGVVPAPAPQLPQ